MSSLSDRVPIPPKDLMNPGLHSASEKTMLKKFGKPGPLSKDCGEPDPTYKKEYLVFGEDVGPFKVDGLRMAVESLKQVFTQVRKQFPDVYAAVRTDGLGMLCVRHKRKNTHSYSNHSWGTAIDLKFGPKEVPQGTQEAQRGFLSLYPIFNQFGWYWGAEFSGDYVDSMHFEWSEESILKLPLAKPSPHAAHLGAIINSAMADHPEKETALALLDALAQNPAVAAMNTPPAPLRFAFTQSHHGSRTNWYAQVPGEEEFLIGYEASYKGRLGLDNDGIAGAYRYDPEAAYAAPFGHWRYLLAPTAICESGGYLDCINTYDSAYFTFGFFQFAAHVAEGDFVQYFRELIGQNTLAKIYFPDLELDHGRIAQRVAGTLKLLEDQNSSKALKLYLNPTSDKIDEEEKANVARFIHWCDHDEAHRQTQVKIAVQTGKGELAEQNRAHPFKNTLHPDPLDTLCLAIMDVLHQLGAGKHGVNAAAIDQVLKTEADVEKAYHAVLAVRKGTDRAKKLTAARDALTGPNKLGTRRYSAFA